MSRTHNGGSRFVRPYAITYSSRTFSRITSGIPTITYPPCQATQRSVEILTMSCLHLRWTCAPSSAPLQIIPPLLIKLAEEGETWAGPPHKMSRSDNNLVVIGAEGPHKFQGALGRTYKGHTGVLRFCAADEQERVIITGGRDGTVRVWSPQVLVKQLQAVDNGLGQGKDG